MSLKRNITKSSILDIKIRYGEDHIKFNLADELRISENRINSELKIQPSYYGFLSVLLNKLKRVRDDAKLELKKVYAKEYIYYKGEVNDETGRPNADKLAEALAIDSSAYSKAYKALNQAEDNVGTIESCVNSFDQRASLIQSISANLREERSNNK